MSDSKFKRHKAAQAECSHLHTEIRHELLVPRGDGSRPENKKLNEANLFLSKYCSALLRRTDLPEIELMYTPAGAAAQSHHLDSLKQIFLALALDHFCGVCVCHA
jgi:hypothetical protein